MVNNFEEEIKLAYEMIVNSRNKSFGKESLEFLFVNFLDAKVLFNIPFTF